LLYFVQVVGVFVRFGTPCINLRRGIKLYWVVYTVYNMDVPSRISIDADPVCGRARRCRLRRTDTLFLSVHRSTVIRSEI
jgi:hypothetical protein